MENISSRKKDKGLLLKVVVALLLVLLIIGSAFAYNYEDLPVRRERQTTIVVEDGVIIRNGNQTFGSDEIFDALHNPPEKYRNVATIIYVHNQKPKWSGKYYVPPFSRAAAQTFNNRIDIYAKGITVNEFSYALTTSLDEISEREKMRDAAWIHIRSR